MKSSEAREARFSEIYEQHFEMVRRYVWRRDPLIADDVAAETWRSPVALSVIEVRVGLQPKEIN